MITETVFVDLDCVSAGRERKCGDRFCRDKRVSANVVRPQNCAVCQYRVPCGPMVPPPPLVGDVLARILKDRHNAEAAETCQCATHIQEMNNWGPDGCDEHFDEIVGWLLEAASETPGIHRWIPEFVKRSVLEGDVRDAIREVREWRPAATPEG